MSQKIEWNATVVGEKSRKYYTRHVRKQEQPMNLFLVSENIRILRDSTGKRFTDFMDSLIRAEAARANIPASAVRSNARINVADGGVDTEVEDVGSSSEHLPVPSLWQLKAVELP